MEVKEITKKEEKLNVWVSPVLKQLTYREAQSKGMNISEYIRYLVRRDIEK